MTDKDIRTLVTFGNNIFAGTSNYGVFFSSNNGTTWIEKNQGFNTISTVRALLITNGYVFAGTANQSIWRRSYDETIGVKNISTEIPNKYNLEQNYPNPFNPITIIKFDIPDLNSPLRRGAGGMMVLKVYDILGKEIETLVNEKLSPGTYEVTFNGSNYSSGIYFYKLTTDSFNETKRMLMIK
jgi:hypothetical protein